MPVSPLSFVRFGHATAPQPKAPAIRPGHAPVDTVQFSGKDHQAFEVVEAHNILADVASAFRENPDTLFPQGFNLRANVNRGFYPSSWMTPFPGSIRLGSLLAGKQPVSLQGAYQRWAEQSSDVEKENIMYERTGEVIPFNRLFDIQAILPDGRRVRMTQTVDVEEEALARLKSGERVHEGLGERELHITVKRGKETLDDIVLRQRRHVDDLAHGMERLLQAWVAWKPGAGITPEISATVDDILAKSMEAQAKCEACACKESAGE